MLPTEKNSERLLSEPYFVPEQGMNIKLVDFQSISCDTSEVLTSHLSSVITTNGDICSSYFTDRSLEGKNNVYS